VEEVEAGGAVFGGGVEFDGDVDEAKSNGSVPDGAHNPGVEEVCVS